MSDLAVVFETPGQIPIEAFTTFGINVKPNTKSPIGYFGTGLKYAVAVFLRLGVKMRMWIGEVEYEFYLKDMEFRGKEFSKVYMRQRKGLKRWFSKELPFTTELGKNWEPWMAFRELYSNTLDEGGKTFTVDGDTVEPTRTYDYSVIALYGDKALEAYSNRSETFLLAGMRDAPNDKDTTQMMEEPCEFLYYRGLRVFKLPKKAINTYNLLSPLELTEDRTIKYQYEATTRIARFLATKADEKIIHRAATAPKGTLEESLDFDFVYDEASPQFMKVLGTLRKRNKSVGSGWSNFYGRHYISPEKVELTLAETLIAYLKGSNYDAFIETVKENEDDVISLLEKANG